MTHYEVLGVDADAPVDVIRRAYVRLARDHHPDFHTGDDQPARRRNERVMQRVNEAWAVLADPARRAAYDREIGVAPDPEAFRPFEPGDDGIDPRHLVDEPYRPVDVTTAQRMATLAPVALFAASVGLLSVGLVLGSGALLALAVLAFVVSCVGFLVIPLVHLSRARDD